MKTSVKEPKRTWIVTRMRISGSTRDGAARRAVHAEEEQEEKVKHQIL